MTNPTDPEDEGLPSVADDNSTAYDPADEARFDDPPALPGDEPVALDDYGLTAEESSRDEPLDARLRREEPDVWPEKPAENPLSVGRLVDLDLGGPDDTEGDAVATDTRERAGMTAEGAAMHVIPD